MEGDKMSAGGGGLIQMILSRAIGRHLSSAAPAWPSDRYFHPLPWCCYRVVTELCAVFVHFCVILTPSALTLWRLLTPSHFHSPSEHSCYKNIAMFTLSSALLSSWPRVTWHGAKHNYAATHNTMGASVSQSEFRLETTDQWEARDPIPGIQTMMGARQTCLESWELCLDLRRNVWGSLAPWPLLSTCPGQGEQLGQIYTLIITRRTGRRQGRPSELGKQRN